MRVFLLGGHILWKKCQLKKSRQAGLGRVRGMLTLLCPGRAFLNKCNLYFISCSGRRVYRQTVWLGPGKSLPPKCSLKWLTRFVSRSENLQQRWKSGVGVILFQESERSVANFTDRGVKWKARRAEERVPLQREQWAWRGSAQARPWEGPAGPGPRGQRQLLGSP